MSRYLLEDTSNLNNLCIVEADTPEQAVDCHMNDSNYRDTTYNVYDLKWSEGEFGIAPRRIERIYPVNSTKMPDMDAPAFAGESQTDRAARGALSSTGRRLCMKTVITAPSGKEEYCNCTAGHSGDCDPNDIPF